MINHIQDKLKFLSHNVVNKLPSLFVQYPILVLLRITEFSFSDTLLLPFFRSSTYTTSSHNLPYTPLHLVKQIINNILSFGKIVIRYLLNMITTFIYLLQIRFSVNTMFPGRKISTLVYCYFPSNWILSKRPTFIFFGNYTYSLPKSNFLVNTLNTHDQHVSSLRKINKYHTLLSRFSSFVFIYSNFSFLDFFRSYLTFSPFKLFTALSALFVSFPNLDSFGLLYLRSLLIDLPKNSFLYLSAIRFFQNNSHIKTLIVPIFELSEARVVISAAKKSGVLVIGMQHGPCDRLGSFRILTTTASLHLSQSLAVPDHIFLEGNLYNDELSSLGYPHSYVIGALRLNSLPPCPIQSHSSSHPFSVLILLDMHDWLPLFQWAIKSSIRSPNMVFILRCHPKNLSYTEDLLQSHVANNFFIDTTPDINSSVIKYSPDFIISSSTGAVLSLALSSWPCVFFSTNNSLHLSPLCWNSTMITISSDSDSYTCFNSLKNPSFRSSYSNYLASCARNHISLYGHSSYLKFSEIFSSLTDCHD